MERLQRLTGDGNRNDDVRPCSVRPRKVDSSSVRIPRHGAGTPRDGAPPQVGLNCGRRTTKVHPGIDGNGMVKIGFLTPGQAADCAQAEALLAGRKSPRPLDRETCRTRDLVERFYGKFKESRRVATRHDKSARNFLSVVHLVASRLLLRRIEDQSHESTA